MIGLQGVKRSGIEVLPTYPLKSLIFCDHRNIGIAADDIGAWEKTKIPFCGFHEEIGEVNGISHRHGRPNKLALQALAQEIFHLLAGIRIDPTGD